MRLVVVALLVVAFAGCAHPPPNAVHIAGRPTPAATPTTSTSGTEKATDDVQQRLDATAEGAIKSTSPSGKPASGPLYVDLRPGTNGPFRLHAGQILIVRYGPEVPTGVGIEVGRAGGKVGQAAGSPMVVYSANCKLVYALAGEEGALVWVNVTSASARQLSLPPLDDPAEPGSSEGPYPNEGASGSPDRGAQPPSNASPSSQPPSQGDQSNWTGHDVSGSGKETPLRNELDGDLAPGGTQSFYVDVPEPRHVTLVAGTSLPIVARFVALNGTEHALANADRNVSRDDYRHVYVVDRDLAPGRYAFQLESQQTTSYVRYAVGFL